MNLRQADSIIFDLDGTLWDATDSYVAAWNLALQRFGLNRRITRPDLESLMGMEEKAVFEKVFPDHSVSDREQLARLVSQMQDEYIPLHGGRLYEFVREGLVRLSTQYKLFIVSNCPEHTVRDFLRWSKLEPYFTDHETHGRTRQSKAVNLRDLVQRNQLQQSIYIGDTESDATAAQQAGVLFAHVTYGFGKVEHAPVAFHSFQELVAAFAGEE